MASSQAARFGVINSVFVDTSAFYALLDMEQQFHANATGTWHRLLAEVRTERQGLLTHHAIVMETTALVAKRLGMQAVRQLHDKLLPVTEIVWINEKLHRRAIAAYFAADRRRISLVDRLSFEVMREHRIRRAFTFDGDFEEQGFLPVP